MIFYFIPPRIRVELASFDEICVSRFKCFLQEAETRNYNKLLVESNFSTQNDQIGHFLLRCFCAYNADVKDFILQRETDLFSCRLKILSSQQKQKWIRMTMEQISCLRNFKLFDPLRQRLQNSYFWELLRSTLHDMYEALSVSQIHDHLETDCFMNCDRYFLKVPFQMCLSLLRTRSITPTRGCAFVPCSMWNRLLVELFFHHYEFGLFVISNTIFSNIYGDIRWTSLFNRLSKMYYSFKHNVLAFRTQLTAGQIDNEKKYFPPCMAHLLSVLRTQHRLSHNWRYRFSLFLKDIGLSFEESVEFWKSEYSKTCTAESSCTHSWQKNHRKYMYSIRHLYGLVGTKLNKETKSCAEYEKMQLGMREEGGCPFVHFDEANVLALLSKEITNDVKVVDEIVRLTTMKDPLQACYKYRAACAKIHRLQIPSEKFKSSVEYYRSMKLCFDQSLDW